MKASLWYMAADSRRDETSWRIKNEEVCGKTEEKKLLKLTEALGTQIRLRYANNTHQ